MNSREKVKLGQFDYVIPTFEEILDDSFNYPEFVEKCTDDIIAYNKGIKQGIFLGIDEDTLFDNLEVSDKSLEEKTLSDEYTKLVNMVVQNYKQDYINDNIHDDIYTPKMKSIAEEYMMMFKSLSDTNEKEVLDPLSIMDKHRIENEVKRIKETGKERALAYLNGEIGLRDLYIEDLAARVIDNRQSRKLLKIKTLICASLPSSLIGTGKVETLKIGELEPYMTRRTK